MASGPRPIPTVLRLIRGESRPSKLKADRPKSFGVPEVPPGILLSTRERAMFEWLLKHVYQAGVHSPGDGVAFVRVARLWARCLECDEWTSENGMLACDTKTQRQMIHPLARLSRDLWRTLGGALDQIGASAGSRYRVAGPLKTGGIGKDDWDDID